MNSIKWSHMNEKDLAFINHHYPAADGKNRIANNTAELRNTKCNFYMDEMCWNDGTVARSVLYSGPKQPGKRYCDTYGEIKYEYGNTTGCKDVGGYKAANRKVEWKYTTEGKDGIRVVAEKQQDGSFVRKVYKMLNYSHPEDSKFFDLQQKLSVTWFGKMFNKMFYADKLLYDSRKLYSSDQISAIIHNNQLPKKAIWAIERAIFKH